MKKDIIGRIIDRLYDYEDVKVYGADLAYTLFESENMDGTFTYNTYEAKEWIKQNFDEIGEVWEELKFQFGSEYLSEYLVDFNPFDNPEKFMVLVILKSASYILGKCKTVEDNWNNEIVLTKENIKKIEKELKELDVNSSIYS